MISQVIGMAADPTALFPATSVAKGMGPQRRKELAIAALAGGEPVSRLAADQGVSRKFVYQQAGKAERGLDETFAAEPDDQQVLYHLPVTKKWIGQLVLAQALEGHSSYRGIIRIIRNVIGYDQLSIGTVHNLLRQATERARIINAAEDLSAIRVGGHDEIYQAGRPVLVGADLDSTYCYLLVEAEHCDETTWGYHLLELAGRGLHPDYTVADGGLALRAGQTAAWDDVPCHGDVFHGERELGRLAEALAHHAAGCTMAVKNLQRKKDDADRSGRTDRSLSYRLGVARHEQTRASGLADDVRLLSQWLQHDILSSAGPDLAIRRELFDFVVEELRAREPLCPHRIEQVRRTLQRQRDDLLAFAGVLDQRLAEIASDSRLPLWTVRAVCELEGLDRNQPAYWQRAGRLAALLGKKFHTVQAEVSDAMDHTPRASSLIENINSRLRTYFFLRRQLGRDFLDLLRFFLNHQRFSRSEKPNRIGKSPAELLTGRPHPYWLELLAGHPSQQN
jgi:hypothetical protein